jgi:hypothetical protein
MEKHDRPFYDSMSSVQPFFLQWPTVLRRSDHTILHFVALFHTENHAEILPKYLQNGAFGDDFVGFSPHLEQLFDQLN